MAARYQYRDDNHNVSYGVLIQNTQNRDGAAIQAKLDELILAGAAANRYIGIEELTEEELDELRKKCRERAKRDLATR